MDVDPIAPAYRWLEYAVFGRALQRARLAFVGRLRDARHVLVLGEGDGRMLASMLAAAPAARFTVIETSARMIALAQARVSHEARVRFLQSDARIAPLETYDAAVTCFFLDCLAADEARQLIHRVARALEPSGIWLVADFAIPRVGWPRWHARLWVAAMYRFFGLATGLRIRELPPIGPLLTGAHLRRECRITARHGLIASEVWSVSR